MALFILAPVARWVLFDIDHQFAHIGVAIFVFLGLLAGFVGIWRSFPSAWMLRASLLLAPVVAVTIGLYFYEFAGVDGETVPVFRFRKSQAKSKHVPDRPKTSHPPTPSKTRTGNQYASSQFLGPDRNGIVASPDFSIAWTEQLPKVLWRKPIGAGWSSFAVSDGLAVTLEQIDEFECLSAFELATGDLVWRLRQSGKHYHPLGGLGPRSTPTIAGGKVYAQTALGIVVCADLQTGEFIWARNLLEQVGLSQAESEQAISWGRSGSPLVVDNQVIVPFGGKSGEDNLRTLISMDVRDGTTLWAGGTSQIAYSSPVVLTLCGVKQIVSVNEGNVTGHDLGSGQVLWTVPWDSHSNGDACASQPVQIDDRRVLLGKGYAMGSKAIELSCADAAQAQEAKSWEAKTVWENSRILKTKFTSAIMHRGFLYGLSDGVLECVEPDKGTRVWRGSRFGQGQAIIVNDQIVVLSEDGRIAIVPTDFASDKSRAGKSIAEMQVLEGIAWNVPVVAGPYLIVRNAEEVVCLISEKDSGKDVRPNAP